MACALILLHLAMWLSTESLDFMWIVTGDLMVHVESILQVCRSCDIFDIAPIRTVEGAVIIDQIQESE